MTTNTTRVLGYYLTVDQITKIQGCSKRHVYDLFKEIRPLIGTRYPEYGFLDDSGMLSMYVYYDYLKYRKALKASVSPLPAFSPEAIAELCPVVERWAI